MSSGIIHSANSRIRSRKTNPERLSVKRNAAQGPKHEGGGWGDVMAARNKLEKTAGF